MTLTAIDILLVIIGVIFVSTPVYIWARNSISRNRNYSHRQRGDRLSRVPPVTIDSKKGKKSVCGIEITYPNKEVAPFLKEHGIDLTHSKKEVVPYLKEHSQEKVRAVLWLEAITEQRKDIITREYGLVIVIDFSPYRPFLSVTGYGNQILALLDDTKVDWITHVEIPNSTDIMLA